MRLIGHLAEEVAAHTFGDFLYVQGIENQVELEKPSGWAVWIRDEDRIPAATNWLAAFRANPGDPQFRRRATAAADLRAEEASKQAAYEKRVRGRRHLFKSLTPYGFGPLTFVLIAASVAVFILSNFGQDTNRVMSLFITDCPVEGDYIHWTAGLPEIRHGQIWRLFTPIFVHMSVIHILCNMLWLRDLGSMIEGRQSSWHLAILTLVVAGCSNFAQYQFGGGPNFGGMSGVVYGLLGYIWLRGKFDPASGLYLHPSTVWMMIIWFFLCYTGWVGPIANTAHAVGLMMGMAWGYLSSLKHR
jgi:GlpG protein